MKGHPQAVAQAVVTFKPLFCRRAISHHGILLFFTGKIPKILTDRKSGAIFFIRRKKEEYSRPFFDLGAKPDR
jgi:hypothetical protein